MGDSFSALLRLVILLADAVQVHGRPGVLQFQFFQVADHVIDRAVLAARIECLETNQNRMMMRGEEQFLKLPQLLLILFDLSGRLLVAFVLVLEAGVSGCEMTSIS